MHLVNHENLALLPALSRMAGPLHFGHHLSEGLVSKPAAREAVHSDSPYVAGGNASGARHEGGVLFARRTQRCYDGPKQETFARACSSREKDLRCWNLFITIMFK